MTPATVVPSPTVQPATYGRDPALARFSLESYERMVETGILGKDDRVELLENYIVYKFIHTPPHECGVSLFFEALFPSLVSGWFLRTKSAVRLGDSKPEPDGSLVLGTARSYMERHPGPGDTGLVVEVADSSLQRDQIDKARIYARAGIPVYWIVNLVDGRVEVHSQPSGPTASPAYATVRLYLPGDDVPLVLDGTVSGTVPAAELLP